MFSDASQHSHEGVLDKQHNRTGMDNNVRENKDYMWHYGHYEPKRNCVVFNAAAKMWTTHLSKKSISWTGTTSTHPYVFRVYGQCS